MSNIEPKVEHSSVDLRTGVRYAKLVAEQSRFSQFLGQGLGVSPNDIIPMPGTTGAIEAVRNHVLKTSQPNRPSMLTVSPGYWRARQSIEGIGFRISVMRTEPAGFAISESAFITRIRSEAPRLVYLSLPNNPTGAIFNPTEIVKGSPEGTAILFDLTLPSREIDSKDLSRVLYSAFRGRRKLFVASSTSKSHDTAEDRIGWLICANSDDAHELRDENRNVVASKAIQQGIDQILRPTITLAMIDKSFALLRDGEKHGNFGIVTPDKMAQTGYVLIKVKKPCREILARKRIEVMWGPEFGLSNEYIRLETLEPSNIAKFVDALNSCETVEGLLSILDNGSTV